MCPAPSGTELIRPFLPATNRELSARFYEALGFTKLLDGTEVTIFGSGSGGFVLTDAHGPGEGNMMMQLMVDDLDAWWGHLQSLDLPHAFGVPSPKPPALQPWGLRVAYVVDPSGILWHVAERRPGAVQD